MALRCLLGPQKCPPYCTQVIEHPDDAFCVLLHAQPHSVAASRPSPDQLQRPQQRIQLFSGYVTQDDKNLSTGVSRMDSQWVCKSKRTKLTMDGCLLMPSRSVHRHRGAFLCALMRALPVAEKERREN
eukprot:1149995-Pelagomonas_calceolata.AAC.4